MNWAETLEKYENRGWNDSTQLSLLLDFLDRHGGEIVTVAMFDDYLYGVVEEENSVNPEEQTDGIPGDLQGTEGSGVGKGQDP